MKMPEVSCPVCQKKLDANTALNHSLDIAPKKGDLSICLYCSTYLTFEAPGVIRQLTDDEFIDLPDDERILLVRAAKAAAQVREKVDNVKVQGDERRPLSEEHPEFHKTAATVAHFLKQHVPSGYVYAMCIAKDGILTVVSNTDNSMEFLEESIKSAKGRMPAEEHFE
jgi:hypothetical protein